MKYQTDEPVKREDNLHTDDSCYTHPSYGMIRICKKQCGGGGLFLFGSESANHSVVEIEIGKAHVSQGLGRNWYYSYENLVSVEMTQLQFAELITSPNTEGSPCTIRYTSEKGHIKYQPIDTTVEYVKSKTELTMDKLGKASSDLEKTVAEILSQKSLKKADKEQILKLCSQFSRQINSSLPFYKEQFIKALDKHKTEAHADIEGYMGLAVNRLGSDALKAALEKPEVFKALIESKEKK